MSYVEPSPFLLCDTIRSNITFGLPYDVSKFEEAIEATCLDDDFMTLAQGEHTTLLEGGSNLSGGQKA